ncbi:hypothetical protein DFA_11583 [Cavenderia fasciculata]|uniref:Uncharacterized protein n=1 Tax=Cavenderia fasciculata TaxID=261658 RepID=F4QDM5_CACFS|nr:uncharacterized protein DFA_11583 [Cavenderia fasciculata]EGG13822.1 hypothetical protein DFA_11583 [Cavenderia fasciculata]|eukprot:XP_004350530.1 hypothetical protein DFA_11583 [Cavenderia fasciculata]
MFDQLPPADARPDAVEVEEVEEEVGVLARAPLTFTPHPTSSGTTTTSSSASSVSGIPRRYGSSLGSCNSTITSTSTTSTVSTTTQPVSRLSKPVPSSSIPQRKSIAPGAATSTNKPLETTTNTPTAETLSTKKKFITVTPTVDDDGDDIVVGTTSPPMIIGLDDKESLLDEKWLSRDVTAINNVEDLMQYSNTLVESLANIEMEIDSLNESNQFNQISDALANNIRDARKVKKEDDEFNWVEDSVDQALIEDDEIDFGESSFKKNNNNNNDDLNQSDNDD